VQRLLSTAILVGLLVATAGAFAITERLKLTKSPIYATLVYPKPGFSPTCGCARGRVSVSIKLRRADTVTVRMFDSRKRPVRTLVEGVEARRGPNRFRWDGRTDGNVLAPDGIYQAEIHLARQHQTILLPNKIQLDTKPPEIRNASPNREAFSPDADKQADFVRITYELSKPAHVQLYIDGTRVLNTYRHPAHGSVSWNGQAHGVTLPPGAYELELGARDLAGNSTPVGSRWRFRVEIRYIKLAARRIVVPAGGTFEIGVATDAKRYAWKLGGRKGFGTSPVLRLRASQRAGRYTLTVSELGHVSRAAVIVR
jgi:hypothetical protein